MARHKVKNLRPLPIGDWLARLTGMEPQVTGDACVKRSGRVWPSGDELNTFERGF